LLWPDDEHPAKQIKSIDHSKTKRQVDMMGIQLVVQLVNAMEEFDQNMR
jgi:hypothetical protein